VSLRIFVAPLAIDQFSTAIDNREKAITMRVSVLITLLPVLVSGRKLARRGPVVSYQGHKVYRVQTPEGESALERRVAGLRATLVEDHHPETWIDVIVEPESVTDFEALNLDSEVLHENLARDIEAEAVHKPYTSKQVQNPNQ
jgi:hypothetical protein